MIKYLFWSCKIRSPFAWRYLAKYLINEVRIHIFSNYVNMAYRKFVSLCSPGKYMGIEWDSVWEKKTLSVVKCPSIIHIPASFFLLSSFYSSLPSLPLPFCCPPSMTPSSPPPSLPYPPRRPTVSVASLAEAKEWDRPSWRRSVVRRHRPRPVRPSALSGVPPPSL